MIYEIFLNTHDVIDAFVFSLEPESLRRKVHYTPYSVPHGLVSRLSSSFCLGIHSTEADDYPPDLILDRLFLNRSKNHKGEEEWCMMCEILRLEFQEENFRYWFHDSFPCLSDRPPRREYCFASGLILGPRIVFTLDSSHWAKGYIDADSRSDNTQNKEDADVDGNSATSMDEDGADSAEDGTDSTEDATTVDEDNVGADERQARIMDEDSVDVQD